MGEFYIMVENWRENLLVAWYKHYFFLLKWEYKRIFRYILFVGWHIKLLSFWRKVEKNVLSDRIKNFLFSNGLIAEILFNRRFFFCY